eukprot:CAMPEP_0117793388 /NCGR_PEP_ID=MMETSP0948-20121206/10044_1 /TAXON_ID=44440 /ORGANISM="Chattonella subsalsa, Strain CCMP2191" /LENGTH=67 /DNA_ID=CAMNT_0005623865 /DNA_START=158 /DNA_END=361 /DNA_ORIENTATION=-
MFNVAMWNAACAMQQYGCKIYSVECRSGCSMFNAAMWNAACAMTYVEAAGACAMQHFGMQQSGMQQQ